MTNISTGEPDRGERRSSSRGRHLNTSAVYNILDATMALNQLHGLSFNAHVTILYEPLGIRDHSAAASLLSRFNHEATKWIARVGKRYAQDYQHFYVYVHENARDRGFHTHQLMWLPRAMKTPFEAWARKRLARLAGMDVAADETVVVVARWHQTVEARSDLQSIWLRYILKTMAPAIVVGEDGHPMSLHEQLGVKERQMGPIHCAQAAGVSRNLDHSAREAFAEFIEDVPRIADLFSSYSLDCFARRKMRAEMAVQIQRLNI